MLFALPSYVETKNMNRPSSHDFKLALERLFLIKTDQVTNGFRMLRAHYNAERQALSAEELAAVAGMKNYVAANTHYGKFARQLCGFLDYEPPVADKNNDTRWTYVLATYPGDRNATGDHLWFLRSEVAQALEDMGFVRKRVADNPVDDIEAKRRYLDTLSEKDRAAMIRARLGQGEFRDKLVRFWGGCAVTGCTTVQLLVASHVKPWRDCDASDARDLSNGLLLTPNLDRAFDLGYISFQDTGEILFSPILTTQSASELGISARMTLQKSLLAEQQHFMQYHRSNILLR
jgi:hypothetical protein